MIIRRTFLALLFAGLVDIARANDFDMIGNPKPKVTPKAPKPKVVISQQAPLRVSKFHWTHPGDIHSHLVFDHHWRGDLSNKTIDQMLSIHDALHEGRIQSNPLKLQRTQVLVPGNCPGGFCPKY